MKPLLHILHSLLAAAALGLAVACGVACGQGATKGTDAIGADSLSRADTLALVEGLRLFENGEYSLAREQLRVSALSESTWIRAESFLHLNALEMELGNYDRAREHLDRYHTETMRLLRGAAEASGRVAEQTRQLQRRQETIVAVVVVFAVVVAGGLVWLGRKRVRISTTPSDARASATPPEEGNYAEWLASAEGFRQTAAWKEIAALAAQKPGREARVMTTARQEVLDAELAERFAGFADTLREGWPALTGGDVKLCCLSLLPLSPFGRALCFGSTETNIVKQRKHTIKKKLGDDERGRAMFEFIFSPR